MSNTSIQKKRIRKQMIEVSKTPYPSLLHIPLYHNVCYKLL